MTLNLPPTPGLVYAALISPDGQLLAKLGQNNADPAIVAVLIQGAMAAVTDLGQRSQMGNCGEMIVNYQLGCLLVITGASGHLALFQYTPDASLPLLRQHGQSMLASAIGSVQPQEPARTPNRQSLMDALNVEAP
ncbi:MAG: roadblock/LC7 domain-containing protein [Prosthecobacter sp.]|nr:roadblock/LC7 domain-containing protein [Prosthecobacter sp.]